MATVSPGRPPVFNLPNQLTAARFVLALVLFCLIPLGLWISCIVVFALAAVTDWLDGFLARKQGLTSTLGRNLDPLVDKVLICGAYIFLLPLGSAPDAGWLLPWMVTVVVARELVITSLRSFIENQGGNFGADWLGKLKMGLQCAALFAVFAYLHATATQQGEGTVRYLAFVRDVLLYAMVAATALSGAQYLWKASQLLHEEAR
jgi:CDP-diacylglycerol--glycerol-3-phosphate 3-phosphatidyltransferase